MDHKLISCPDCKGRGHINGGDYHSTWSRTCARCHGIGYAMVPKTRADKIREMKDEDLTDFIYDLNMEDTFFCTNRKECREKLDKDEITDAMCKKCLLRWLQNPASELFPHSRIFEDKQESGLLEE